jgi:hypothetical protein
VSESPNEPGPNWADGSNQYPVPDGVEPVSQDPDLFKDDEEGDS